MPRGQVQEYTRQLNGRNVRVQQHSRHYNGQQRQHGHGHEDSAGRTPVQQYRREHLRAQAKQRRTEAFRRGKDTSKKAGAGIRRRGKQSWKLARRAGRRWSRGARYAGKKRRMMAACCFLGGTAELGVGLAWSVGGLVWATVAIGAAVLSGGLLLGRQGRHRQTTTQ